MSFFKNSIVLKRVGRVSIFKNTVPEVAEKVLGRRHGTNRERDGLKHGRSTREKQADRATYTTCRTPKTS